MGSQKGRRTGGPSVHYQIVFYVDDTDAETWGVRLKANRRWGWLSLALILAPVLVSCQKPPQAALEGARSALDSASAAGALRYAEKAYREAESTYKSGMMEVARQKGRLAPLRRFQTADSLLTRAFNLAWEAARQARDLQRNLEIQALNEQASLREEVLTWRRSLDGALNNFRAERHWSSAELSLETAARLIREKEFQAALETIAKGRQALVMVRDVVAEYTNHEAQELTRWRAWVQETLRESRERGTYAIIVDKSAHKTYLVKAGKLIRTYACDLGYNSAWQKLFAGDGATPEGKYHVTQVKRASKYYRALPLNFPNDADRKRFRENKARGIISSRAGIGKNIEIHGSGGRGEDWTEGCVALSDADMDHLLRYAGAGTPVTIVRRSDQWP
ncbi:MAG: murein L,D-transpeptidase [Candidatus Zixiibacteriota bacterium]|nr:MAG: murein L,D-transpeptidase [candidate division Zixibacteria bacterium]